MRAVYYAVNKKIATGVLVTAFIVMGIFGLFRLPVDFLPSITYPMIKVHIWWGGATPEDIDKNLADPIERQMATVDNVDYLESSSIEGMYTLLVNFGYGVDVDVAYQDALAAMARAARQLPEDIEPPVVIKSDPSQLPIAQLTISSDTLDLVELRTWVDEWLQDKMIAVKGVAGTEIVGGLKREIRVELDPVALEKYQISIASVLNRLKQENIQKIGGRLNVGSREIIARTMGEFESVEQIKKILIEENGSSAVYLSDIATVIDSHEDKRVFTSLNGKPCVKLSVLKQADANTVATAEKVIEKLESLKDSLPSGINIGIIENQADYIKDSVNGVKNTAFQAALLVIIIVWLFVGSWKQIIVIAAAIPVSVIINFALMKAAGFSINIFSLGGLVVAIGVLLSNSIVVMENITRWIENRKPEDKQDIKELAAESTSEVAQAVTAATITFLALFLPFLFVPGLVSLLFRELILVVSGIVIISLITALTFTPMLMSLLYSENTQKKKTTAFQKFFHKLTDLYTAVLQKTIKYRYLVILIFIVILSAGFFQLKNAGSEFLPKIDDGRIMVKVKMPTGSSLSETEKVLSKIEKTIQKDERIENIFNLSGGKVWGLYTYEIANEGELDIYMVPPEKRTATTEDFVKYLRKKLSAISVPGGKIIVAQMKMKGIRKLGDADIEVKIKGENIKELFSLANKTASLMRTLNHFTNIYVSMDMTKPEYRIHIDRERAYELGVSIEDAAKTLNTLISGSVATKFRDRDQYYNIRLIVPEKKLVSAKDIENLPVKASGGRYIRLGDFAEVSEAAGPVEIVREDQIKQVIVRGDVTGTSIGQALLELKNLINENPSPPGYEFVYGGQAQMMKEMTKTISGIALFAVFFAFIVLAVQFNSLKIPGLIILCIPFCFAGMIFAMNISGLPFGATVIIGTLIMIAAMVNDGILLMEFSREIQVSENISAEQSIIKAGQIRFRPLVMTSISTLVGFIPLALSLEQGGDMLQPMAVAAVGGLLMEIFVVLFFMPCIYVAAYKN